MAASENLSGAEFKYPPGMEVSYQPPGEGKSPEYHSFYSHVPDGPKGNYLGLEDRTVVSSLQLHPKTGEVMRVGTADSHKRQGLASHLVRTALSMGLRPRYSETITDDGKALAAAHGMTPKKPLAGKPKKRVKAPEQPTLF